MRCACSFLVRLSGSTMNLVAVTDLIEVQAADFFAALSGQDQQPNDRGRAIVVARSPDRRWYAGTRVRAAPARPRVPMTGFRSMRSRSMARACGSKISGRLSGAIRSRLQRVCGLGRGQRR
jgi:hypothetical protein